MSAVIGLQIRNREEPARTLDTGGNDSDPEDLDGGDQPLSAASAAAFRSSLPYPIIGLSFPVAESVRSTTPPRVGDRIFSVPLHSMEGYPEFRPCNEYHCVQKGRYIGIFLDYEAANDAVEGEPLAFKMLEKTQVAALALWNFWHQNGLLEIL
ncbi:hypothetical protein CYLTODRAFT_460353 [Cylindrobasidium torrendii FP15055 ss-10]|uniref:Uncharacterized protein n=1 Tax=Cylindrobasidium torrendii FP15055 ss-10 TaxID=1314674 RepID=A0A0D7AU90_9AGAR|nr:hypothetical protein CYLTODRAFT_460353 [Cylindrobasidium torrendii FP15055 ss-10]